MASKKYLPLMFAVISSFIFGFSYFFTVMVMDVVGDDTFRMLAIRFTASFLVMTLLWRVGVLKMSFRGKRTWKVLLAALFSPLCYYVFEAWALLLSPSSQLGLISSISPVVTVSLGAVLFKEYPSKKQILFIGITLSGVLLINIAGYSGGAINPLGLLFMVLTTLSGCFSSLAVKGAVKEYTNFEIIYINMLAGAVAFAAISAVQHILWGTAATYFDGMLSFRFIVGILYLAVGSSIIGFGMSYYNVSRLPIAVNSSFSAIGTVVTILVGVTLMGEPFSAIDAIGSVFILAGVWMMNTVAVGGKTPKYVQPAAEAEALPTPPSEVALDLPTPEPVEEPTRPE